MVVGVLLDHVRTPACGLRVLEEVKRGRNLETHVEFYTALVPARGGVLLDTGVFGTPATPERRRLRQPTTTRPVVLG